MSIRNKLLEEILTATQTTAGAVGDLTDGQIGKKHPTLNKLIASIITEIAGEKLGVGTITPNSTFHIEGSVSKSIDTKIADFTLTLLDYTILVDATTGVLTMTLPTAIGIKGRIYNVKKIDVSANAVTVDANGVETIDGSLTQVLNTQNESVTIQSDGANWFIL